MAHLDDVAYLLNNTEHFSKIKRETDKEEYKMVEIITSTWANFATYGYAYPLVLLYCDKIFDKNI